MTSAAAACREEHASRPAGSVGPTPTPKAVNATFVGREKCAPCHAEEDAALARLAPRPRDAGGHARRRSSATSRTRRFTHFGVTSTFFKQRRQVLRPDRRPGRQAPRVPDRVHVRRLPAAAVPDRLSGRPVPGAERLLGHAAGEGGRAALVPPLPEGGGRPRRPAPLDRAVPELELHVRRMPFDEREEGLLRRVETRYATTWSEIDVSCEACHGPGSAHVAWAEAVKAGKAKKEDAGQGLAVVLKDPAKDDWIFDPKTGIAKRSVPRTSQTEIETCARCHARRSVVAADYVYGQPLMQTHRPVLLIAGLYFADGQIEDEVYEYGSFLQSKMHAAGVTCSNCHNPHDLKVPVSADRVCAACHLAEKFDTPKHHFHKADSTGASCIGLPHADAQLHGRPRAPRPQLPRAAAGPVGLDRDAERLHAVPQGQVEPVGGRRGAQVVGRQGAAGAALRRDRPRRARGARGRRRGPGAVRGGFRASRPSGGPRRRRFSRAPAPRRAPGPRSRAPSRTRTPSSAWGRSGRPRRSIPASAWRWSFRSCATRSARFASRRPASSLSVPKEAMSASERAEFEKALAEYVAVAASRRRPGGGAPEPGGRRHRRRATSRRPRRSTGSRSRARRRSEGRGPTSPTSTGPRDATTRRRRRCARASPPPRRTPASTTPSASRSCG